jgi:hypothetical protein
MERIGRDERQRGHMFMFFMVRNLLWSVFMDRRRCCMVRFISNLSRVAACVQHRFFFTIIIIITTLRPGWIYGSPSSR